MMLLILVVLMCVALLFSSLFDLFDFNPFYYGMPWQEKALSLLVLLAYGFWTCFKALGMGVLAILIMLLVPVMPLVITGDLLWQWWQRRA